MTIEARCALVVDDAGRSLGELALQLTRLGIDCFYAPDPQEAWLLAKQEARRIRLLLLPPEIDLNGLESVLAVLAEREPDLPRSLLVLGPRPGEERRDELRKAGVYWAVWEPWDESALRMALAGAMSARPEAASSRCHPRFPTRYLGRAFKGVQRQDGLVSSLSEGGAFLETPSPFQPGTPITLEIEVDEGSIVTKAEVLYIHEAGAGAGQAAGMGVGFGELSSNARARLERTVFENQRRFEV